MTLVQEGAHYEVTAFRGPGGLGRSLNEDLGCRDFTINAMAYDVEGRRVIDPHGGREDIARLVEDYYDERGWNGPGSRI